MLESNRPEIAIAVLDALLRHEGAGFALLDPNLMLIRANRRFREITGSSELSRSHLSEVIVPEERAAAERHALDWLSGSPSSPIRTTVERRDGTTLPVELRGEPVYLEGAVVGLVVELRDLRSAEESRARADEAERIRVALVEHAPIGIAFIAPDLRVVTVNPAMERMLGAAPARSAIKRSRR